MKIGPLILAISTHWTFVLADWVIGDELRIVITTGEMLKANYYIWGLTSDGWTGGKSLESITIREDITERSNITVRFEIRYRSRRHRITYVGDGYPFCTNDTSSSIGGTMTKIVRMALNLPPEGCPISQEYKGSGKREFSIWGLQIPEKRRRDIEFLIIIVTPDDGDILQLTATYTAPVYRGYGKK